VTDTTQDELFERGLQIREEMLGAEHGRAKVENANDFTRDFEHLVTRYCFGEAWGRDALTRAQRSTITIALLVGAGRSAEVGVHVAGALNNGVSVEEIREILFHATIYCGVPAALEAYKVASGVLADRGLLS